MAFKYTPTFVNEPMEYNTEVISEVRMQANKISDFK